MLFVPEWMRGSTEPSKYRDKKQEESVKHHRESCEKARLKRKAKKHSKHKKHGKH